MKIATGQVQETSEPPRDPKADHADASWRPSHAAKARGKSDSRVPEGDRDDDGCRAVGEGVTTERRLSPQESADPLKRIYELYDDDGQVAGGMFGLHFGDQMEAGSTERSLNTIAEVANLTYGADVKVAFKKAPHVNEIFARAAAGKAQQQALETIEAMCEDAAAETYEMK